jgi:hypothetical protein
MKHAALASIIVLVASGCLQELGGERRHDMCKSLESRLKKLPQRDVRNENDVRLAANIFHQMKEQKCLKY